MLQAHQPHPLESTRHAVSPFRQRTEDLLNTIKKDVNAGHRGQPGERGQCVEEFREITRGWLFDPRDLDQFQNRHQELLGTQGWSSEYSTKILSMSGAQFYSFLAAEAQSFAEHYLDQKWRGYTACQTITNEVDAALIRYAGPRSTAPGYVEHHTFNLVVVDGQPYWLDFTFDQFFDYARIKSWQQHIDTPAHYHGILILPIDSHSMAELHGRIMPRPTSLL